MPYAERVSAGLQGLLPPAETGLATEMARAMVAIERAGSPMQKYQVPIICFKTRSQLWMFSWSSTLHLSGLLVILIILIITQKMSGKTSILICLVLNFVLTEHSCLLPFNSIELIAAHCLQFLHLAAGAHEFE